MNSSVLTVYEQEVLYIGDQRNGIRFEEKHLQQLARIKANLPRGIYRLEYRSVRFGNLVGVIQLPQFTIEILPKISQEDHPAEVRIRWTTLLQQTEFLPYLGDIQPQLLIQPGALLNALKQAFFAELTRIVNEGLLKKYQTTEGQQPFLRGKLLVSQQIKTNLIHKHRFYTRSRSLLKNHPINQRLKQALQIVELSDYGRSQSRELLVNFRDVKDVSTAHTGVVQQKYSRATKSYQRALSLANLICEGYLGGSFVGEDYGFSLLFDMSRVFEAVVHQSLVKLSRKLHFEVTYQPSRSFWERKQLRPDFTIDLPDGQKIIVDTKWKILNQAEPSDEDLRQIFAYTQIFQAQRGILLYPEHQILSPTHHVFSKPLSFPSSCEVQFISILENLEDQFSKMLFG